MAQGGSFPRRGAAGWAFSFTVPRALLAVLVMSGVAAAGSPDDAGSPDRQWGAWRGPLATGVSPSGRPPVSWSETENVRWKVAIPGRGVSTPVIWNSVVYLTTAVPHGEILGPPASEPHGAHDNILPARRHRFVVMALDAARGGVLWRKTLADAQPHEGVHATGSWASPSPVTDGEHLIVSFGSRGLFGLDMQGEVVWKKDLGEMRTKHGHGEGSTPLLHGDTVVVNWDHEGDSFIVALDKRTGRERWRKERLERTSWSTPIAVEHAGRTQVIVSATRRIRAYDLRDGTLLWECGGLSDNVVASPVAGGGMVFAGSSYDTRHLVAIRLEGARGDITGTDAVRWTSDRNTPYVPSFLLDGDTLYYLRHLQGILSAVDRESGATRFGPVRLPGVRNVHASPVSAAGRVYITGRNGVTVVLEPGTPPKMAAVNQLDDVFSASAAIYGDALYLRGESSLYCLAGGS